MQQPMSHPRAKSEGQRQQPLPHHLPRLQLPAPRSCVPGDARVIRQRILSSCLAGKRSHPKTKMQCLHGKCLWSLHSYFVILCAYMTAQGHAQHPPFIIACQPIWGRSSVVTSQAVPLPVLLGRHNRTTPSTCSLGFSFTANAYPRLRPDFVRNALMYRFSTHASNFGLR